MRLIGKTFGSLSVVDVETSNWCCRLSVVCQCVCGREIRTYANVLLRGKKSHCGCMRVKKTYKRQTPRHKKSSTHSIWCGMKKRCYTPTCVAYKHYGGRGILVCERWRTSFQNFVSDMGERPEGKSLDRIDNDGPYSPENCRWTGMKEQSRNTRKNTRVSIFGETKVLVVWSEDPRCAVSYCLLRHRIADGWSPEEAFTTPARPIKRQSESLKDYRLA